MRTVNLTAEWCVNRWGRTVLKVGTIEIAELNEWGGYWAIIRPESDARETYLSAEAAMHQVEWRLGVKGHDLADAAGTPATAAAK